MKDVYGEIIGISSIVSQLMDAVTGLYQIEMGRRIEAELEKDAPEEFFRKYQFLTLSTYRSWVGRDARLLVISVRKR